MSDLLADTDAARLRRALRRRLLRYGLTDRVDVAADAALSLVRAVLEAKDAEITRLRSRLAELEPSHGPTGRPGTTGHPTHR